MAEWWEDAATVEDSGDEWWSDESAIEVAGVDGDPSKPKDVPVPKPTPKREERQIAPGVWSSRSIGEIITGVAETGAMLASTAISEPLAGVAGIYTAATEGAEAGAEAVETARDMLTYQPRTEAGQEYVGDIGEALAPVGEAISETETAIGQTVLDATGSPELATLAHTMPTALLEGLGLRMLRVAPSQAAADAAKAQQMVKVNPGMTAADVAEAMAEPEAHTYKDLTEMVRRGDQKALAAQIVPDEQIMKAAEELGIELAPDHYSTNEAFIRVGQALKSRPDSQLADIEAKAIVDLGEKADALIKDIGGEIDRSVLDESVRGRINATTTELNDLSDKLYTDVDRAFKSNPRLKAPASRAYLKRRLDEMGGEISGLSGPERALYEVLNSGSSPTYRRFDKLRKDVGDGYNKTGAFKDEASGNLDAVYEVLSQDQQAVADAFGVGGKYKMARKLVQERKLVEEAATDMLGKELQRSILPKLKQAAGGLTQGDTMQFKRLMEQVPPESRQQVAATMLNDLFVSGARKRGASIGQGFADAYSALERNAGAKKELFKYLPEEAQKRFDAIGKVSEGLYRARKLENTSRTARDILHSLESATYAERIIGRGAQAIAWTTSGTISGLLDTQARLARKQARRVEKGDALMSSPGFSRAMRLASENRVEEANILLKRSKAWQAWRNTLGEESLRQVLALGPIAYLTQQDERQEPQQPEAAAGGL